MLQVSPTSPMTSPMNIRDIRDDGHAGRDGVLGGKSECARQHERSDGPSGHPANERASERAPSFKY